MTANRTIPGARTYEQMRSEAIEQRRKTINGEMPAGTFKVTSHENLVLRMQPLDNIYLSYGPDFKPKEICGIPIEVTQ